MTDWTSGYVADIDYIFGYYTELNPLRSRLALLTSALVSPDNGVHCELGFGQGMSANIHAAASASTWYGTDFNPAQAGFAQSLAKVSGASAHLYDQSFADFCTRTDLPEFDSIGLHGIWSWISDQNRQVIVDFVRRKLKVGGVLYISYNTQPGWAAFAPMRHLMTEHAAVMGADGVGTVKRVEGALEFAEKLLATNPSYLKNNPLVAGRLKAVKGQNRNYLAHEYFNKDWQPMHFATMAQWLAPAKINYAGSANYLDHVDPVNLTTEQQTLLKEIPDPLFRQTARDFMVNQQFRKDYWVKGARKLSALEQSEALRAHCLILVSPRADVALKVTGSLGEADLQDAIYSPILDALADHKPKSLGQLELAVKDKNVGRQQLLQAVTILAGAGHLEAVQDEATITKARKYTDKLNAHLLNRARGNGDIDYLASPVTGGGVMVGRVQQLFLLALSQGKKQPAQLAKTAWTIFAEQQQRVVKDGKPLQTPEENLAELTAQAQTFADKRLPILKALQIV